MGDYVSGEVALREQQFGQVLFAPVLAESESLKADGGESDTGYGYRQLHQSHRCDGRFSAVVHLVEQFQNRHAALWRHDKSARTDFAECQHCHRDCRGHYRAPCRRPPGETPLAVEAATVEHCRFDYMKAHAEKAAPLGGIMWNGGAKTFINKGTNGRWRDVLTAAEVQAYDAKALAELGTECARWLAGGRSAPS